MTGSMQESLRTLESRLYMYTVPNLVLLCERLEIELASDDNVTRPALVKKISEWADREFRLGGSAVSEEAYKKAVKNFLDQLSVLMPEVPLPMISASVSPKESPQKKKENSNNTLTVVDSNSVIQASKLKNMKTACICGTKGTKKDLGMWITCTNPECGARFHHDCMPWSLNDKHNFECPSCLILSNDPLNDVIGILVEPSILISEQEYTFKLASDQQTKIQEDHNIGVEIRTIKCDGEHFYEQTWPDKCSIKLNNELIKEVKPLHQNSSLKKRKDEKIFSRKNIKMGSNSVWIQFENVQDGKNTKPKQDPKYVFVVVLVRRVSVEELSLRIRNMNTLSIEECKEFIKEKFLQNKDLEINEIKVNLIDNISFTTIKHPARGLFCDHVPCFSLDYFLLSMENNYTRKWACPMCKKRCNKFVVDSYIEKVVEQAMKKDPELENVFFLKNGDVIFKSDILEEETAKRDVTPPKPEQPPVQDKKDPGKDKDQKQNKPPSMPRASIPKPGAPSKLPKQSIENSKAAEQESESLEVLSIISDDSLGLPKTNSNLKQVSRVALAPPSKTGQSTELNSSSRGILGLGAGISAAAKPSKPTAPLKSPVIPQSGGKHQQQNVPAPQQVTLRSIVGDLGFKSQNTSASGTGLKPGGGPLGVSQVSLANHKPPTNSALPWNKAKEHQPQTQQVAKSQTATEQTEVPKGSLREKLNQLPSKGYNILKQTTHPDETNEDLHERGSNMSVPEELMQEHSNMAQEPLQGEQGRLFVPAGSLLQVNDSNLKGSRVVQEEVEEPTTAKSHQEGLKRVSDQPRHSELRNNWKGDNRLSGSSMDEEPEEEMLLMDVTEMATIISNGERREEPVLDRLVNKNIRADQDLKSDFELLHKLQTAIQRVNDNIDRIMQNSLRKPNSVDQVALPRMISDEDILRLTDQEKIRSKCIDLLHSFVLTRQKDLQAAAQSRAAVFRRYQILMHSLEAQDYYFDEFDPDNQDTYLVKRKPRAPGADRDLLESLLQHYGIGNDKRRAKLVNIPPGYYS